MTGHKSMTGHAQRKGPEFESRGQSPFPVTDHGSWVLTQRDQSQISMTGHDWVLRLQAQGLSQCDPRV